MEDESTRLCFNKNSLKFTIKQEGKPPYTFQQLSSGYSSILRIYADLVMRVEYFEVPPKELNGVVLIDEIDAHLHVSLQKLILPFLTEAFPSIQFIVTTHSPFVLMSADSDETIVYDIGTGDQFDENLSYYSYSAVMEAVFGTKPVSKELERTILEMSVIANTEPLDYDKLEKIVSKIAPVQHKLNYEEKAYYLMAENKLLDRSHT